MAFLSMTGFGEHKEVLDGRMVSCQIHGVNSRYLNLRIKVDPEDETVKSYLYNYFKDKFLRGTVNIHLSIEIGEGQSPQSFVDHEKLIFVYDILQTIKGMTGIEDKISMNDILNFKDFFIKPMEISENFEQIRGVVEKCVQKAYDEFFKSALEEGGFLEEKLKQYFLDLSMVVEQIVKNYDLQKKVVLERIEKWLKEVDKNYEVSEKDISSVIEKADIQEEIDRIKSHLEALQKLFDEKNIVKAGKKIEFLCVELHRELNTIASKSIVPEISKHVVEGKLFVEKIKEQSFNIA